MMIQIEKLKVAIAGAGMVSRHHIMAWNRLPQAKIVAICARRRSNARNRADEFSIPAAYDNVARMLDETKPDVLDIATPPEIHAELALLAADRHIHILCQKPMTPNLKDARQLVAAVKDRVRLMVHENWRFRPPYRQAAQWLQEGRAGEVREFQLAVRSSGLSTRTRGGRLFALERQPFLAGLKRFIIMELLIHHLDTIRYLMGPVQVESAVAARVCPEVIGEDVALISLRAENGALGTVCGNLSAAGFPPLPTDRLELIGEKGSIIFENNSLRLEGERKETIRFDFEKAYQQSYDNAIAHFVGALEQDTPFETGGDDNLQTLMLVEEAYRLAGLPAAA
jgi:predicted dehydrogenase